jgi:hypothetical protein
MILKKDNRDVVSNEIKALLYSEAEARHNGSISPCSGLSWNECYQEIEHYAVFHYNQPDGSTRTIIADMCTQSLVSKINLGEKRHIVNSNKPN